MPLRRHAVVSAAFALAACQLGPTPAAAQDEVPAAVAASFATKYPGAEEVRWGRDRNDSHEAHFRLDGRKLRADFDADGTWIETEESVRWKDLPEAVRDAVEGEYDEDDVVELEFTDNAEKGEFYDVELDPKGEKKFDVEYRADGTKL